MLGYTQGELLGRNIRELIPAEELIAAPLHLDEIRAGETVIVERRLCRKDGSLLPVEISAKMIEDGWLQGIVRDITERKQAETALQESEAQYRSLFENSPIPISEQDFSAVKTYIEELQRQGVKDFSAYFEDHPEAVAQCIEWVKIINMNKASLELYRASSKEDLMTGLAQILDQESYEAFKDVLIAIALGKHRFEQETINYTLTHERKDIVLSWSVVPGYEESCSKVLVSIVDVTGRKRLEEQLRQAQKMEAVGRLAGGVAHDFNNILTVIKGYSGLLMDNLGSEDPQYKDIEQIGKAAERAALLTNQLLAFSRKQVLQPVTLDLNLVVMNMDKMLRRLIGEDIELVTMLDPNLGKVKVDPSQMEQVIINLAINARDAMPFGGKLMIETANVMFDKEYVRRHVESRPGSHIMLAIIDTGQGMDEETQSHLFEPFFTTKEQGKGTGLGLATVHGIVTQSGGHIWVYSEVNQGTTVKVYLPQVEDGIAQINQKGQASLLSTQGLETILLVEDEESVRELARRVLSAAGYTVLEAQNGEEAVRVAEQHGGQIDLLLTDVIMPGGMSGRHLAERLAALLYPELKVLYMSGYTDSAIIRHGVLDAGIAFLQKPFTPTRLAQKVREILDVPL
jgi:signal transduction histidine kinase